jgi:Family of unknown function (DUF5675)
MLITVTRTNKSINPIHGNGAFGHLGIDVGPFKCVTLENADTLIPAGVVYDVLFMWSEAFQQMMPHVIVPGRTAIEIHWANWVKDPGKLPGPEDDRTLLDGCTSLGQTADFAADAIWNSKAAWIQFCKAITDQPSIKIKYVEDY